LAASALGNYGFALVQPKTRNLDGCFEVAAGVASKIQDYGLDAFSFEIVGRALG